MHRFKDLEIWKLSRLFCKDIFEVTLSFPDIEKFGLTSHLKRASVSIPSNIVEGASRNSNKDFARFLEITIESLSPLLFKLEAIIKMTSKFESTLK